MNTNTGKLTAADFDDVGLALATRRHEGLDIQPAAAPKPLAWKCNQGRGPVEHVTLASPGRFGRPGRGPETDWEPSDAGEGEAIFAISLVGVIAWIGIVGAVIEWINK